MYRNFAQPAVKMTESCDSRSAALVKYDMMNQASDDAMREQSKNQLDHIQKTLTMARQIGVKLGGGIDADEARMQGKNAKQLTAMVGLGASPLEAIQTETVNATELLGWSDTVGSLEKGKLADIIAVDSNPLVDISTLERVRFVMKGGEVIKNELKPK